MSFAKLSVSGKLISMATKLIASDFQTSAYAFALVHHNFHGKQLFVDFIGGEASSAANDCIKLFEHPDLASLQFDPGGYLSGEFSFDPDGALKFNPNGFVKPACALSSKETNGYQHLIVSPLPN